MSKFILTKETDPRCVEYWAKACSDKSSTEQEELRQVFISKYGLKDKVTQLAKIEIERRTEGYWYSKREPQYPMPMPNVLTKEEAVEIFNLIRLKEVDAREVRFKGMTTSRLTEKHLGSTEFRTDEWAWPFDFAPHYVLEHRVKPTNDFLKYIGFEKNLTTLRYAVQGVIINENGEVLCVSRKHNHSDFGLPGGKVDDTDATFQDAIAREIKEETGLDVDMSTSVQVFSMHRSNYMGYTYLIKDWSGEIGTDEPHVVKWGTFQELIDGTFGGFNILVRDSLFNMGIKFKD